MPVAKSFPLSINADAAPRANHPLFPITKAPTRPISRIHSGSSLYPSIALFAIPPTSKATLDAISLASSRNNPIFETERSSSARLPGLFNSSIQSVNFIVATMILLPMTSFIRSHADVRLLTLLLTSASPVFWFIVIMRDWSSRADCFIELNKPSVEPREMNSTYSFVLLTNPSHVFAIASPEYLKLSSRLLISSTRIPWAFHSFTNSLLIFKYGARRS